MSLQFAFHASGGASGCLVHEGASGTVWVWATSIGHLDLVLKIPALKGLLILFLPELQLKGGLEVYNAGSVHFHGHLWDLVKSM